MVAFRIVEYSGYEILVFAWLPPSQHTFKATYNIHVVNGTTPGSLQQNGVIAGAFGTAEAAQEAAIASAQRWIGEQSAAPKK